jgi:dynactin 6
LSSIGRCWYPWLSMTLTFFLLRRKEVMRIGDDNLFAIGCRTSFVGHTCSLWRRRPTSHTGIECPSMGSSNTISTRSRVHHTIRLSSHCTIGPGVLLVPPSDEVLPDYTVVYGPGAERRRWSGRGKVQELDLRRKHAEYLREMLPKFNRLRRGDGA